MDRIRMVLPSFPRRDHQFDLDVAASQGLFRRSPCHFLRQSNCSGFRDLRLWLTLGDLVQQEHNRARHHGFWVGTFAIFVLATVQIICFGWIWGIKNGAAELDQGALIKIPRLFLFVMKWVTPVYLLVVLGGFTYFDLRGKVKEMAGDPVALSTAVVILVVLVRLMALLAAGERRWRAAGLDIDGRQAMRRIVKQ